MLDLKHPKVSEMSRIRAAPEIGYDQLSARFQNPNGFVESRSRRVHVDVPLRRSIACSTLLAAQGIDNVVLEHRSREYVEARVRAGVLEQGSVDLLREMAVAERMDREGLVHHGIELRFEGQGHRIPLTELAGGRSIMVYGQQEVVKDLINARLDAGGTIVFDAQVTTLQDCESGRPRVKFLHGGAPEELEADYIAGCDGFHGVSRGAIPGSALTVASRCTACARRRSRACICRWSLRRT